MNNVVKELVLIRLQSQNFVSVNNDTYNNISGRQVSVFAYESDGILKSFGP